MKSKIIKKWINFGSLQLKYAVVLSEVYQNLKCSIIWNSEKLSVLELVFNYDKWPVKNCRKYSSFTFYKNVTNENYMTAESYMCKSQ